MYHTFSEKVSRAASIRGKLSLFGIAALLVLGSVVMIPNNTALAVTNGPNFAGSGASSGGSGTVWTNPGGINADDNVYATDSMSGISFSSEGLEATNFGFSIPAGVTISGIQASIGRFRSDSNSGDITDNTVRLMKAGAVVGNNKATSSNWPTAEGVANYGANNDLWGTTWTPAQVNASNFGVSLVVNRVSLATKVASVDYVKLTAPIQVNNAPTLGGF